MSRKVSKSCVWAVDPFMDSSDSYQKIWPLIQTLSQAHRVPVQPVYVLAPASFNWSGEFSGPWVKKYAPKAEAALDETLALLDPKLAKDAHILVVNKSGVKAAANKLAAYCKSKKPEFVVIQTHGKKGLERMTMGSFAETMILQCKLPLFIINPKSQVHAQVKRILFPTDFSKASEQAFRKILSFAKRWQCELVLYHKFPDPIDPIIQQGVYTLGGGWISLQQYFQKDLQDRQQRGQRWVNEAKKQSITAHWIFDEAQGDVVKSILAQAQKSNASLLAMASSAGPATTLLLGSVTRNVVREAQIPVFVLH